MLQGLSAMNSEEETSIFNRYISASGLEKKKLEEEIILRNIPLAVKICKKFDIPGYEFDDLLSIACQSLITATRCFDPSLSFKFSTYAGRSMFYQLWREWGKYRLGYGVKCNPDKKDAAFDDLNAVLSIVSDSEIGDVLDIIFSDDSFKIEQSELEVKDLISNLNNEDASNIIEMLMQGYSKRASAKALKMSPSRVDRIVDSVIELEEVIEFTDAYSL